MHEWETLFQLNFIMYTKIWIWYNFHLSQNNSFGFCSAIYFMGCTDWQWVGFGQQAAVSRPYSCACWMTGRDSGSFFSIYCVPGRVFSTEGHSEMKEVSALKKLTFELERTYRLDWEMQYYYMLQDKGNSVPNATIILQVLKREIISAEKDSLLRPAQIR